MSSLINDLEELENLLENKNYEQANEKTAIIYKRTENTMMKVYGEIDEDHKFMQKLRMLSDMLEKVEDGDSDDSVFDRSITGPNMYFKRVKVMGALFVIEINAKNMGSRPGGSGGADTDRFRVEGRVGDDRPTVSGDDFDEGQDQRVRQLEDEIERLQGDVFELEKKVYGWEEDEED